MLGVVGVGVFRGGGGGGGGGGGQPYGRGVVQLPVQSPEPVSVIGFGSSQVPCACAPT